MLEVLRSLSPPRSAPDGSARRPQEEAPPPPPAAARPSPDAKHIRLRVEEVGIFFLAGVMLVVMAFLMGWYARRTGEVTPRRRGRLAVDALGGGRGGGSRPAPAARASARPVDAPDGDRGGEPAVGASRRVRTGSARRTAAFSILLARFPLGGAGDAEDHRLSLRQRGYPAWLRRTPEGIELCVGRFGSPAEGLARQWLPKLRKLSAAYSPARIVRIP